MSDSPRSLSSLTRKYLQDFVHKKKDYLQTQVGNPEGADKPNKKVYAQRLKRDCMLTSRI